MTLVTALVRDPAGNPYVNALVEASFLSNIPAGTGSGPPLASGSVFQTFAVSETDSFGNLSMSLTDLAAITPSGGSWNFNVLNNARTIGFNLNSFAITGTTVDISAALQAASAPLNPQTGFGNITVTGLTDTGSALLSGNVTAIAGQNQFGAFKINSELWIDGKKYAATDAGITAAIADLPTGGGVIHIPPATNPAFAGNLTISKPVCIKIAVPNTLTLGANQIIIPAGVDGVAIIGEGAPYGGSGSAFQRNAVSVVYTGASAGIQVGANGATDTHSFMMWGVQVDISGGTGTAIGLKYTQVTKSIVAHSQFSMNVNGQIGVQTNGGTTFSGTNTWHSNYFQAGSSVNVTGMQFGGDGNQSNADVLSGENHFTLGGPATTSVGIDKKAGDTLIIAEASVDNALWGLTVESTAAVAVWGFLRIDSTTTNIVNFGAGSQGSKIWVNGNKPFTDNGVAGTNSVENPARNNFRTDVWQNEIHSNFALLFKDLLDSGNNRITLVNGAGGDTGINPGSGGAGLIRLGRDVGLAGVSIETAGTRGMFLDPTGRVTLKESVAPAGSAGNTLLYADSTSHRLVANENNAGAFALEQIIASGTSALTANAALAAVTSQAAVTTGATGTLATDAIEWCYASAPGAGDSLCIVSAYVTANNVNFVRSNPTAAAQSVSAIVINWRVIR